jgi:hypothetical protein
MGSPILELAQQALAELGLTNPPVTSLVGSSDNQSQQVLALLKRAGDHTMRKGTWPQLENEWLVEIGYPVAATGSTLQGSRGLSNVTLPPGNPVTPTSWAISGLGIPATARVAQVYSDGTVDMTEPANASADGVALTFTQDTFKLPDDVLAVTDRTGWDRGRRWMLEGPLLAFEDQALRSGVIVAAPRWKFRTSGSPANLIIRPPPATPDTLVFEYLSKYWITSATTGLRAGGFTSDNDTCVFDDDVMVNCLKYLFFRARGWDYGGLKSDYDHCVYTALAQSKPHRIMNLGRQTGRRAGDWEDGWYNIPDGNYPGPAQ